MSLPAVPVPETSTDVFVPVDLCNATKGRIHIVPSGVVDVEAEGGTFSNAQCFTSLDGAWFVPAPGGFQPLSLIDACYRQLRLVSGESRPLRMEGASGFGIVSGLAPPVAR